MSAPPRELVAQVQRAIQALQGGHAAAAEAACTQLLARFPDSIDGWRLLGHARLAQDDAATAAEALARAEALSPGDPRTVFALGTALLQSGEAGRAFEPLQQAMRAMPDEPLAAFRYGTCAYALQRFEAAKAGFEAATRLQPAWPEAWNNLAATLGRLEDHDAAIAAARRALQLRPDANALEALAVLLVNRFDAPSLQEGLQLIAHALRLAPRMAKAHLTAALLLRKTGDLRQAEHHARQARELAPADVETAEILGELQLLQGKADAAIQTYEQASAEGVESPILARQLGIALLQDGQPEAAVAQLDADLRKRPGDQRTIAHLGAALEVLGRHDEAERLLGMHRHVRSVRILPPEGFDDDAAFRAALADDIRRHSRQRWEPAGLAARNAYLSGDLLADRTPAIVGFEQRLREAIDAYIAACEPDADDAMLSAIPRRYRLHVWATQADARGFIDTHIHEESWLSGAYYVELPASIRDDDPAHAGWIEFGRPPLALSPVPDTALRLTCPTPGTLLLFPSYLFHRTLPFPGDGERISISFDLAAI
ncbi:putative 2OG-Fe(II) oxygenase [Luteimonas vadosa]|uniref:2OG-Fe(II) oxygenase n=1 Tax=Luteimonas vadosa TaxID=1165507 RepID=A0ABP9DWM3_9GAMM